MSKWIPYENDEGMYDIFDCEDNYIQFGMYEEDAVRIVNEHNKCFEEEVEE